RTERLRLKNNKFKCFSPASKEAIAEIFKSIYSIDSTLKVEETTQAQIRRHPALVKFMETHCQMRTYSFQVKKCNNPSCLYCKPIRLPPHEFRNLSFLPDPILSKENADHYAAFQQVYGTKTTEEFRPTYIAKSESIPKYILVAEKIRDYINCENCRKRRCVYSNKSLTDDEQRDYQQALESYSYSCGAPVFPDDHYLIEVIFVRTQINCDSPIEILYYSSRKAGNYPICYYCGSRDGLVTPSQSLKEQFKQIYPLCEYCQKNQKDFHTKGTIKTNNKAAKHPNE
ncbi:5965_t:CDS:2, partial [Racocetra persica]